MKVIGLTGSIATGKSTALQAFAQLGIPVFSADNVVHELYAGGEAVAAIEALAPGTTHDQGVDRAALARRLTEDPALLPRVEAAVHPLVRSRMASFLENQRAAGADFALVEIPLLFETGHDYGLDVVVVTAVSPQEQRARALARPGMTVEKLETILARQLPQSEKIKRADHVIDTSGTIAETARQVAEILDKLRAAP